MAGVRTIHAGIHPAPNVFFANANNINNKKGDNNAESPDNNDKDLEQDSNTSNIFFSIKKGFNFIKGIVEGFCEEFKNMIIFTIGFFTNPIGTIKTLASGIAMLAQLLANPNKLAKFVKDLYEHFCSLDENGKGKIIGRILFNLTPIATVQNVRIISTFARIPGSIRAVASNYSLLVRYHRLTGRNYLKTALAARRIMAKYHIKRDFERALRLEGIPKELAPKLVFRRSVDLNTAAYYRASEHIVCVNTGTMNFFPIGDCFLPGFSIPAIIRHEVKHAGQHLLIARAGLTSQMPASLKILPKIEQDARRLSPVLQNTKLYKGAQKLVRAASKHPYNYLPKSKFLFIRFFESINYHYRYLTYLFERQAFMAGFRYGGVLPAIRLPSIHNLKTLDDFCTHSAENTDNENKKDHNDVVVRNNVVAHEGKRRIIAA